MTTGCSSTSSLVVPPTSSSSLAIAVLEAELTESKVGDIDSFYLTPCEWPTITEGGSPQDVLLQVNEIMTTYAPCFVRHNGLIEILNK